MQCLPPPHSHVTPPLPTSAREKCRKKRARSCNEEWGNGPFHPCCSSPDVGLGRTNLLIGTAEQRACARAVLPASSTAAAPLQRASTCVGWPQHLLHWPLTWLWFRSIVAAELVCYHLFLRYNSHLLQHKTMHMVIRGCGNQNNYLILNTQYFLAVIGFN